MNTEVALVDNAGEREAVEEVHKQVVDLLAIVVQTLTPEIVLLRHRP